ncbi:MAG: hypothetical protein PUB41_00195 [bacterium]|nr:hypothetical protein [bacterium]MDD6224672.1 hypothetical protein [bacterium]MDY3861264.1 hypothetical protein [Ruminococcus sp.]
MIKGINRNVIEVTKTDNIYYERAILILRPEFTGEEKRILEKEARKMLRNMNAPSVIRSKRQILRKILYITGWVTVGVLLTLGISFLARLA